MIHADLLVKYVKVLLAAAVFSSCGLCQTPSESNISCMESMVVPSFTNIARRARGPRGSVDVEVLVGKDGVATKRTFNSTDNNLQIEVDITLRMAKFKRDCQGKTVRLRFEYVFLEGEPVYDPVLRVVFKPPNIFELASLPLKPTVH